MLIRRLSCLLFFYFMTGCVAHHKMGEIKPVEKSHHSTLTKPLPSFVNVYVDAPVNVNLHTNQRISNVTLSGDARDVPLIFTQVKNQTLYVTLGRIEPHLSKKKPHYGKINVDINMQAIHGLIYRGNGRVVSHNMNTNYIDVWIKNLGKTCLDGKIGLHKLTVVGTGDTQIDGVKSDDLKVYLYGRPRVQLTGTAALSRLDIHGDAMFSFYWLSGRHLMIRSHEGSPKIQVAGVVERLDVELWGKTKFNGRYIRARQTFVKTHEHAIAEIATTSRQHTLALDASDIYFYNLPTYLTNFMGKSGAILDMRPWDFKLEQQTTPYNK